MERRRLPLCHVKLRIHLVNTLSYASHQTTTQVYLAIWTNKQSKFIDPFIFSINFIYKGLDLKLFHTLVL